MAVSAATDKRFRRAHVSPARKRRWIAVSRKHLVYAAVATAILLAGIHRGATHLLSTDALTVNPVNPARSASPPYCRGSVAVALSI